MGRYRGGDSVQATTQADLCISACYPVVTGAPPDWAGDLSVRGYRSMASWTCTAVCSELDRHEWRSLDIKIVDHARIRGKVISLWGHLPPILNQAHRTLHENVDITRSPCSVLLCPLCGLIDRIPGLVCRSRRSLGLWGECSSHRGTALDSSEGPGRAGPFPLEQLEHIRPR